MNAVIAREACPALEDTRTRNYSAPAPCVILLDGVRWTSPTPENSGEAIGFTRQAEEIVAACKTGSLATR
jgi:hypothetical protein